GYRSPALRPLVAGGHDQHELVVADHPAAPSLLQERGLDESEIGRPLAHSGDRLVAVGGGHDDFGSGGAQSASRDLQRYQPARHELFGDREAGRYFDAPAPFG